MGTRDIVKRLSHDQRELLVEHVPGFCPIDYRPTVNGRQIRQTMQALIRLGLIREDRPGGKHVPTHTKITELGREVVASVLAEYAEALMSAGYTGLALPLEPRPAPITVAIPALELA